MKRGIFLLVLILALAVSVAVPAALMAGDKDEDGETAVTLDELPAAVKATLEKAAAGGTITEIEKQADGSYEAEFVKDGKEFEVEIAADGTLLETEAEEADEDNDADEADDAADEEDEPGDDD